MPSKHYGRSVFLQRIFVLLTVAVSASASNAAAQSKEILDGARKEGQLVFYSGIPIPDAQAILSALEKKYPFIKTTFYRATGPALVSRIQTEQRQWRVRVDDAGPSQAARGDRSDRCRSDAHDAARS